MLPKQSCAAVVQLSSSLTVSGVNRCQTSSVEKLACGVAVNELELLYHTPSSSKGCSITDCKVAHGLQDANEGGVLTYHCPQTHYCEASFPLDLAV